MGDASGAYRLLELAGVYEKVQDALGGAGARRRFVAEFMRPHAGATVLDIGCGTAAIVSALPDDVSYTGFDANPKYIDAAKARYGPRGTFICARVGDSLEPRTYDFVLARGVMHHLDDATVRELLATARRHLVPGGVLVTIDPVIHDGQPRIARWLVTHDRGRHVRTSEGYVELVSREFRQHQESLVTDLLPVPYSHLVIRASAL
jgi:SAM-dependent methyltransferase